MVTLFNPYECSVSKKNKLCQQSRDSSSALCGKCKDGFSETTSHAGICKRCNSQKSKMTLVFIIVILISMGFIFGLFTLGKMKTLYMSPIWWYLINSMMIIYPLYPCLSSNFPIYTLESYQWITKMLSFDLDIVNIFFGVSIISPMCIYDGLQARSKLFLDLIPSIIILLLCIIIYGSNYL